MKFWGEAAVHDSNLHNVTRGKSNDSKTPYEIMYNKKPDVSKLRIFGCAAYIHEPKERREWKLSQRGNSGILLGHMDGMYRVWNTKTQTVSAFKHVLCKEDTFPYESIHDDTETGEEDNFESSIDMNEMPATNHENDEHGSEDGTGEATSDSNVVADVQSNTDDAHSIVSPRYPTRDRKEPERYVANAASRGN